MKILSNSQIRMLEAAAVTDGETTVEAMTEAAGTAVADEVAARWSTATPIIVFAGWGGNGADALSAARQLFANGYSVCVYLFAVKRLSPMCRTMRTKLDQAAKADAEDHGELTVHEVGGRETFRWPDINGNEVIVDGLFGSGLTGELPRSFQMIVKAINDSGVPVVAIDMPTGLHAEEAAHATVDNIVHATVTLAQTAPRLTFMLRDYADAVGEWKVISTGVPAQAIAQSPYTYYLVGERTAAHFIERRKPFTSKADYGNLLIYAGSNGMYGAAVIAATSALRAGAGKVTVHSGAAGMPVLQTAQPSAMFSADKGAGHITTMAAGTQGKYTCVAVGPGIGTHNDTINALEQLLKSCNAAGRPLVLDADALNCIAQRPLLLEYLPVLSVVTPHPGEFDRIFGEQTSDQERLMRAIDAAAYHKIIIVLKGHYTAIVRPDGKVFFNGSGNAAMATPGSGDALTGVIGALMAQGYKPEKASFLACYIHGVAGDIAESVHGDYGVTAMDIANCTGRAIKHIEES